MILPYAENIHSARKCIDSLAAKACTDPNLFGWPVLEHSGAMHSPGGSVFWNGISAGAKTKNTTSDSWLISTMESRGIKEDILAGYLTYYAKRYLPGVNPPNSSSESSNRLAQVGTSLSEEDQKLLLEDSELVSTNILFGLLRTTKILRANLRQHFLHIEKDWHSA
ncbi:hypothetical protein LIER_32672 [Lithospermum erythrorhizon]|uniref:NPH3 domain-containing protein n=1 Tax=Lithospermum erythrorhizon TaxID=34254 RepID=A0AAV3RWR4_LITER